MKGRHEKCELFGSKERMEERWGDGHQRKSLYERWFCCSRYAFHWLPLLIHINDCTTHAYYNSSIGVAENITHITCRVSATNETIQLTLQTLFRTKCLRWRWRIKEWLLFCWRCRWNFGMGCTKSEFNVGFTNNHTCKFYVDQVVYMDKVGVVDNVNPEWSADIINSENINSANRVYIMHYNDRSHKQKYTIGVKMWLGRLPINKTHLFVDINLNKLYVERNAAHILHYYDRLWSYLSQLWCSRGFLCSASFFSVRIQSYKRLHNSVWSMNPSHAELASRRSGITFLYDKCVQPLRSFFRFKERIDTKHWFEPISSDQSHWQRSRLPPRLPILGTFNVGDCCDNDCNRDRYCRKTRRNYQTRRRAQCKWFRRICHYFRGSFVLPSTLIQLASSVRKKKKSKRWFASRTATSFVILIETSASAYGFDRDICVSAFSETQSIQHSYQKWPSISRVCSRSVPKHRIWSSGIPAT